MSLTRRLRLAALACCACCLAVAGLAGTPQRAAALPQCSTPGKTLTHEPWAQKLLDPERVWPLSTGAGIKVGVIDSGVDANQPQLSGHVAKGGVAKGGSSAKSGDTDCIGAGTQVAGVIAAQKSSSTAFHGMAPGVTIVPIRTADALNNPPPTAGSADWINDPNVIADAIDQEINFGVNVIAITTVAWDGSAKLKAAVATAQQDGIAIIAAVGDNSNSNNGRASQYPGCYPGVIGVNGIDVHGNLMQSNRGKDSCVDLVAPGVNIVSTQREHGLVPANGTQMAAAFVTGAAALVLGRYPSLTPAQLKQRLDATATPASDNPDGRYYGHGVVNPYDAVAADMASAKPAKLAPMKDSHPSRAQVAWEHTWSTSARLATALTGGGLLLALLVVLAAVAIPRGRKARWRARHASPPVDDPEADMPQPPLDLFRESER